MTTKMFSLSCVCMYVSLKKYDIIGQLLLQLSMFYLTMYTIYILFTSILSYLTMSHRLETGNIALFRFIYCFI